MSQYGNLIRAAGCVAALVAGGVANAGGVQRVSATAQELAGVVSVDVQYQTTPQNQPLTGLGLRLHYDSSALSYVEMESLYSHGLIAKPVVQSDLEDYDHDPVTDKYLLVAWVDIKGAWPAGGLPTRLYQAKFDGLSAGKSTVKFTAGNTAAGYGFSAMPVEIEVSQ